MLRPHLALILLVAAAANAAAQCADGSPPPCDVARRVPVRLSPPAEAERGKRFLVLPFRNTTGSKDHAWLVEGSTTLLADALSQWQDLQVVPDGKLYPALKRHGLTPGAVMDDARVKQVAEETGGWTAVSGEVLATGPRVRVTARATDVVSGKVVVRASQEGAASDDIRTLYQKIAAQLLATVGIDASALDISNATTSSAAAYRAYARGVAADNRAATNDAKAAFLEAVKLDSNFAQAYARLAGASLSSIEALHDPQSDAYRYAARAGALAEKLPVRERRLVRGISSYYGGQFAAARVELEQMLAADSTDVDALEMLGSLELTDGILVGTGATARRRGSVNRAARLAKRAYELDPSRHTSLQALTQMYGLAAGLFGGVATGYQSEAGSLSALMKSQPVAIWTLVLRDTFELIPLERSAALSPDSLAAMRKRALPAAEAWSTRWLQVGPNESAAQFAGSRIAEFAGRNDDALRMMKRAESLGVQGVVDHPAARRMILNAKLGNYTESRRLADSLAAKDFFGAQFIGAQIQMEPLGWAFHVAILRGNYDFAGRLFARLEEVVKPQTGAVSSFATGINLCARSPRPLVAFDLPLEFVTREADSLLAGLAKWPRDASMTQCGWLIPGAAVEDLGAGKGPLLGKILDAALAAGARRDSTLAYRLARTAMVFDTAVVSRLADATWYTPLAMEDDVSGRFAAVSAVVGDSSAVFTWRADSAATYKWNRPRNRVLGQEYQWQANVRVGNVTYQATALVQKAAVGGPGEGKLAEVVKLAQLSTYAIDSGSTTPRRLGQPRVEVVGGELRMIIPSGDVLTALKAAKPAEARLWALPCVRIPSRPATQCAVARLPITYR